MAACVVEQQPLYSVLPVGQEIIFVVSNDDAVANQQLVKFCVEVHISNDTMPVTATSNHLIGIFKATPNNAGVGIFDMRNIIENYVAADNRSSSGDGINGVQYKNTYANETTYPIHIIDKFSKSTHINAFMVLQFYVEYLGATDSQGNQDDNVVRRADGTTQNSDEFSIFNGYVKHTDIIKVFNNDFGYDTISFQPSDTSKNYLSNMPIIDGLQTVECNYDDYGTVAFYQPNDVSEAFIDSFIINYYNSLGLIQATVTLDKTEANGAFNTGAWSEDTDKQVLYLACFPGNFQNWASNIPAASVLNGGYILISAVDAAQDATMRPLKIKVRCPDQKSFQPIRLCWLNQWGGWDYWTFTKKSTVNFKGKMVKYNQLAGSWNQNRYHLDSHRGGQKTFRINQTEQIRINTDYVEEDYNSMFEALILSPEVYMLEGYQSDGSFHSLNTYVTPVTLTSSNFTRMTKVNDNLIQYSFTIEKTKTLRTQSI